jgi:hypothetical protein
MGFIGLTASLLNFFSGYNVKSTKKLNAVFCILLGLYTVPEFDLFVSGLCLSPIITTIAI